MTFTVNQTIRSGKAKAIKQRAYEAKKCIFCFIDNELGVVKVSKLLDSDGSILCEAYKRYCERKMK